MRRILGLILLIPLVIGVILFAFSNRAPVSLGLWPLSSRIEAESYVVVIAPFLAGLLVGGILSFLASGRSRRQARKLRRETRTLGSTLAATEQQDTVRAIQERRAREAARRDRAAAEVAAVAEREAQFPSREMLPVEALPKAGNG